LISLLPLLPVSDIMKARFTLVPIVLFAVLSGVTLEKMSTRPMIFRSILFCSSVLLNVVRINSNLVTHASMKRGTNRRVMAEGRFILLEGQPNDISSTVR